MLPEKQEQLHKREKMYDVVALGRARLVLSPDGRLLSLLRSSVIVRSVSGTVCSRSGADEHRQKHADNRSLHELT